MNRGWKRGVDSVASPTAAQNFNSPFSPFNVRNNITTSVQANPWDLLICPGNNTLTITLPLNPSLGDQVMVVRNGNSSAITIATGSPTYRINGIANNIGIPVSSSLAGSRWGVVTFIYLGQAFGLGASANTEWVVLNSAGTDGGIGMAFNNAFVTNAVVLQAGSNTSGGATITTPTLGAAATVNTTADVMLYIVVGTAGTLTIAYGPTSGVANTIVSGIAAPLGAMYTVRLPAGWYIAVTTGTTATWTTTAQVC